MVTNIHLRHQCLDVGHIVYKKSTDSMTLQELQERLADEDPEILKNLRYHARNIEGSSQYFHFKNVENLCFNEHLRYSSNDTKMFNVFQVRKIRGEGDDYLSIIFLRGGGTKGDFPSFTPFNVFF